MIVRKTFWQVLKEIVEVIVGIDLILIITCKVLIYI